jgi:hypothetical protein
MTDANMDSESKLDLHWYEKPPKDGTVRLVCKETTERGDVIRTPVADIDCGSALG